MAKVDIKSNKRLHNLLATVDEWRRTYHTNDRHDIIFQNKGLLTNVVFNNQSMNAIRDHSRGFEAIPDTIMHPDEVWSKWRDPKTQKNVLRSYIKFSGKLAMIVITEDGKVTDAFVVPNSSSNKYRKGVILKQ
jgi:hypothetical protein